MNQFFPLVRFGLLLWMSFGTLCRAQEVWRVLPTGTSASLRGLYPIDRSTAWTCGSQATVLRTTDSGRSWTRCKIEGLDEKSELRSIHAWSADEVVVATAGAPCRIYSTKDAGITWKIVYENEHPDAFIDGLRFWDKDRGFVFGDPIEQQLLSLVSQDRGQSFRASCIEQYRLRPAEAGFAASNSSLLVFDSESVWIGLGGATGPAQVLMSDDGGRHWTRSDVDPIPASKSSGVFSLARSPEGQVIAVGGDYMQADKQEGNIALYDPQEKSWKKPNGTLPGGYRSSVIYLPESIQLKLQGSVVRWICAGPNGCDASVDANTWTAMSKQPFHALAVAGDGSVWACGSQGRVGLLAFP